MGIRCVMRDGEIKHKKLGQGRITLGALIVLVLFMSLFRKSFATAQNMMTILRQVSILGITACGLMLILLCGHVDLSIGAVASFGDVLFALLVSSDHANIHPILAILVVFSVCYLIGCLKAFLVIRCKTPLIIASLGISMLINGINYLVTNAKIISNLNEDIIFLGQGYIGFVPWTVVLFVIIIITTGLMLKKTYFGRYIYAIGSNINAVRLAGVNVDRVQTVVFGICTILSGFGGIILCCRVKGGQAMAGDIYQTRALAACAAGGISLSGGHGSVYNVICGVLLIGVITNSLSILGMSTYWQEVIQGLVLIVSVIADNIDRNMENPFSILMGNRF